MEVIFLRILVRFSNRVFTEGFWNEIRGFGDNELKFRKFEF